MQHDYLGMWSLQPVLRVSFTLDNGRQLSPRYSRQWSSLQPRARTIKRRSTAVPAEAAPFEPAEAVPTAVRREAAGGEDVGGAAHVGPSTQLQPSQQPSARLLQQKEIKEMLLFAVPALGMCLAEPLMTLVETACLGHVSAVQLAGLGPSKAILNFTFPLFAFLRVATTNTIASSSHNLPSLSPEERATRLHSAQSTLSSSLCLAVACGTLAGAMLLARGAAMLAGMGTPAEVVAPALQYLRIRALSGPAALLVVVSQGACLGQQDSWTPFLVLATMGILTAAGDIYLIAYRGAGVAGAGAATVAAQWVGAACFMCHLWSRGRQKGGIPLKFMGLPSWATVRPYLHVASTMFGRTFIGMTAYFAINVAATQLGTVSSAAHQVAIQVFWFLNYFPEPLSLAAQSLIARDRYAPQQAAQWAHLLLKAGAVLGLGLAAVLAGTFTWGSWIFTSDIAVQQTIAGLTPTAVLGTIVCCVMMLLDGISIGAGDFGHLPPANAVGLGLTLVVIWAGHHAGVGIVSVWWALVTFYATRVLGHLIHFAAKGECNVFGGGGRDQQKWAAGA